MEFIIKETESSQRIDKFLKRALKDAPVSFIYRMFRQKDVKVNGVKAKIDYLLKEGDHVSVYLKEDLLQQFRKQAVLRPVKPDFDILYEDENILVADKPKGLLVHAEEGEKSITLQNMVLNHLAKKGEFDINDPTGFLPSPAHRLDRNTSGIVLFGKNLLSLNELIRLFRERKDLEKKYTLLVCGRIKRDGTIDFPLKKDPKTHIVKVTTLRDGGKEAHTVYHRLKAFNAGYSLVEAELLTGRTHQLRVHFAYIGNPIVGDAKYGDFEVNDFFKRMYSYRNQFLHASYFRFKESLRKGPLSYLAGKEFISPLPKKEIEIIDSIKRID